VWDCRTGRSIITLQGHVKQILSADFAPDGWRLATGGGDNSVRVWDLRRRGACLYNIPAHRSMVSTVRWQPGGGHALLSAGYDNVAKVGVYMCVVQILGCCGAEDW
jgi:U4/U6 small nuclear ribonucleoprotein PRP4